MKIKANKINKTDDFIIGLLDQEIYLFFSPIIAGFVMYIPLERNPLIQADRLSVLGLVKIWCHKAVLPIEPAMFRMEISDR
jgi:hypothetical protein